MTSERSVLHRIDAGSREPQGGKTEVQAGARSVFIHLGFQPAEGFDSLGIERE